jgi:hypothetical protein
MIAGLSKAITLYLAPLLALTSIFLSLFSLLAPTVMLHDQVSLLSVVPSTALVQQGSSQNVDGASVFLGALGSCARTNNAAKLNCTAASVNPVYELSALPQGSPSSLLSAPAASTPAFISVALAFSIIFFFSFTMITLRHKMSDRISAVLDKPLVQRSSAWIGFFSFLISVTSYLILRMWFGKAVQDFNASIAAQGQQGPKVIASLGNAFTMVWVSAAFQAIPIIISLSKLHVIATKKL